MNSTNSCNYRLLYISWACSLHLWVLWLYRVFIDSLWAMNVVMTLYECSYDTSVQPYLNLIQFLLFFRPEILAGQVIHTQCDLLYGNLCMCVCVWECACVCVCENNGEANNFKMELFNDIHEGSGGCLLFNFYPTFGRSLKPLIN